MATAHAIAAAEDAPPIPPPSAPGEIPPAPPSSEPPIPPPGYGPLTPPPEAPAYPATAEPPFSTVQRPLSLTRSEPPGARSHKGFLLRLVIGLGYSKMATDADGGISLYGVSFQSGIQIGGAVGPVNLFADFFNATILAPRVKDAAGMSGSADVTVNGTGFGAGIGYYFPNSYHANLSFGGGLAQLSDTFGLVHAQTDVGFSTRVVLGKEWWAGPEWGLGVALEGMLFRVTEDPGIVWLFGTGGISFVATYQ